jgi:hypothetical protein
MERRAAQALALRERLRFASGTAGHDLEVSARGLEEVF